MSDLQAAAERLARHQMCVRDCQHLWNAHRQCQWCHSMQRDVDVMLVAAAYLSEHPADDDEPIDEAWLRDCGFLPDAYGLELREPDTGWAIKVTDSHKRWEYMGREINPPKTRGQLHRLLAALGVRLT